MLKKLLLFTLILGANMFAATYYVDSNIGNDANSGTSTASAWKSISKVNGRTFSPGDNILFKRGSIWSGTTLKIASSGTSSASIIYGSYGTGNLPVIDGDNLLANVGYSYSKNYVTIQEIKFQNAKGEGTLRIQNGTGMKVQNCEFLITAHGGVFLQSTVGAIVLNNKMWTPAGNLIGRQTDGIYMQWTTGSILDGNNIVISNTNIDEHCDGIQSFQDNSVTIRNNYIEQINSKTYNSQGIYMTEGSGTNYFYNNVVKVPATKSSVLGYDNMTTSGTTRIYGNTLIGGGSGVLYIKNDAGMIAKNNIIIGLTSSPPAHFTKKPAIGNLNNNIYKSTSSSVIFFEGTNGILTMTQLKSLGYETAGKNIDPGLGTDYRPILGSPAIDAGVNVGSPYAVDMIGTLRPQGNGCDIGAYEYKSGTIIVPPTTPGLVKAYAYSGTLFGNAGKKTVAGSKGSQVIYIADNSGFAKYTVNIPTSGTWYIWGRLYYDFPTPSGCNSFNVKIDAGANMIFGNKEVYRTWHWDGNNGVRLSAGTLAAGTHTITVSNRETSTLLYLDMIVLSNDPNYVPQDSQFGLGKEGETDSVATIETTPDVYELAQNYPNPFNPSTVIKYSLPKNTEVSVIVYDILGAQVAELFNGVQDAGSYQLNFNGANLASGTYIYMIRTKDFTQTKKMMLIK